MSSIGSSALALASADTFTWCVVSHVLTAEGSTLSERHWLVFSISATNHLLHGQWRWVDFSPMGCSVTHYMRLFCLIFINLLSVYPDQNRHSGTVVECRSIDSELSLSCTRLADGGWPLTWVNHPLQVNQPGQLSLSSFRGRYMSSTLQLDVCYLGWGGAIWWMLTE